MAAGQFSRAGRSSSDAPSGREPRIGASAVTRRGGCGGSFGVLALIIAIGQPAERQAAEIEQRADGEHDPRVADQQREEQHDHDEDRQHHVGRHALADPLAGKDRQPRHHQKARCRACRAKVSHATTRSMRHAEEVDIDRQQHGDRAGRRRHADEEIAGPGRPVRVVDHDVEARQPQPGADREHHARRSSRRSSVRAGPRNTGSAPAPRRN